MSARSRSRREVLGAITTGILGCVAGCAAPTTGQQASDTEPVRSPTQAPPQGTVYTEVYRQTVDSVLHIRAFVSDGVSQGSGFVYPEKGVVLTNEHVVRGASALELRFSRGEWRTGSVVGTDVYSDLAVVRVDDPPSYARPLELVDEDPVVGERVVSIGSPFGLEKSLSVGVVSGVNRTISTRAGFSIPGAIQTDAAVNPGNSGGPLVTLDGLVVGIIRSGGGENIGFAVSSALIERVVPALISRGEYEHPFLGVRLTTVTPSIATANELPEARGVLVVDVLADGPAAGALTGSDDRTTVNGVRVPTGGDVIVAIDSENVQSLADLSRYLAFHTRPGDVISLSVLRGGRQTEVEVRLGERPQPQQM